MSARPENMKAPPASDTVTIEVDGRKLQARKGEMLIRVTDAAGIYIPRFCYHKKLSVAANCRMCLVEVEKAPKPLPACATPVADGMVVHTRSEYAHRAQKGTMEFLLINHPLDCPICDEGGECDLQDQALGYGKDASRYTEVKRIVKDKNIGPLIATEMTRCIHCTRCVRFGKEIAGVMEFGGLGRGEHMEIRTFLDQSVDSEVSGNVIDLCPVGALTSKPYRFTARAWELQEHPSISPHDCVGANVIVQTRRGKVMRVLPRDNEAVNECWLADRDRFSYQALNADDRLRAPMIRRGTKWEETDWSTALEFTVAGLRKVLSAHGPDSLGALA
jgi:NADH-quinone oxidoreductase subunit G